MRGLRWGTFHSVRLHNGAQWQLRGCCAHVGGLGPELPQFTHALNSRIINQMDLRRTQMLLTTMQYHCAGFKNSVPTFTQSKTYDWRLYFKASSMEPKSSDLVLHGSQPILVSF
jgi:hypothetical protein